VEGNIYIETGRRLIYTSPSMSEAGDSVVDVVDNLQTVRDAMKRAVEMRDEKNHASLEGTNCEPRLVAVSKTKPFQLILDCYGAGQRNFGENYAQELSEKAHSDECKELCPDIRWHFIGPIQSNKIKMIAKCPNLYVVETVASQKVADLLDKAIAQEARPPLLVFVQVNTSGEDQKSGEDESGAVALCGHIREKCSNLKLAGLMTIGAFDHDLSKGPNPDFQRLIAARVKVCQALELNVEDLELSMGMSNDFEHAIDVGSTNVRVGSTIFGARTPKKN